MLKKSVANLKILEGLRRFNFKLHTWNVVWIVDVSFPRAASQSIDSV